jgi:hypothetical protein
MARSYLAISTHDLPNLPSTLDKAEGPVYTHVSLDNPVEPLSSAN